MPIHPSDEVVAAWARLIKASRLALAAVEADLKKAGLPPLGWYDALLELRRAAGPLRPVELEGRLLLAQHNVSRLVDRLEAQGYVARQPCEEDGRGQLVELTDSGRDLLRRMWPTYRAAIHRHVGAKLGDEQAATLARLLQRLLQS
ncbi:MAG: MarR family transcriptional regulator [Alphaproteobacteria bacterium]|nr:MarR family transcriptional regulator [Alphaproteobacteria bacterium]